MGLKRMLKRRLPGPLVAAIRRVRHARKIGALTAADDKDFRGITHLLAQGDAVIDVGANMGYFTKFLSTTVGERGIVYSIEPIPDSFRLLSYVTGKLKLQNVHLINCAASDTNDVVTMEIPFTEAGEENFFEARITPTALATASRTLTVSTRTLDSLIPWKERGISFVKCDVEGHELPCLKGAAALIEGSRPSWLLEIWGELDAPGSPALATVEFLANFGYRPYLFDGSLFHHRLPGEQDVNYFFFTETHAARLKERHLMREEA